MRRAIVLAVAAPSSRRTRCRQASTAAAVPALVTMSPVSTNRTLGSTVVAGKRRCISSAYSQWVVLRRPSSSPVAPSTNDPEQALRMMLPPAWACRIASSTSAGYSGWGRAGQTITRSLPTTASRPWVGVMLSGVVTLAASGRPGWMPQTRKSNSMPSAARSMPKISVATPNSKTDTGSRTITLTLCSAMDTAY